MAVAAFALATGSAHAHGSGWVISERAKELGITKDFMELTASDIDRLTNRQARGLAQVERGMWGNFPGAVLHPIKTQNSREFLKEAAVIFRRELSGN
jgi:hypothetical protein